VFVSRQAEIVNAAAKHMSLLTQSQITHYLVDCGKATLNPTAKRASHIKDFFHNSLSNFDIQM
jgi:hypothetical protein